MYLCTRITAHFVFVHTHPNQHAETGSPHWDFDMSALKYHIHPNYRTVHLNFCFSKITRKNFSKVSS